MSDKDQPILPSKPKALMCVGGKPMIQHVLDSLEGVCGNVVIVINPQHKEYWEAFEKHEI